LYCLSHFAVTVVADHVFATGVLLEKLLGLFIDLVEALVPPALPSIQDVGSVNVYGPNGYGHGSYSGTSTTTLPPTVIPAHPPAPMVMDEGSLLLSVDLSRKPAQLSVAGKTLTILQADSVRLLYVLSE
jgi:hypothetical protein